MKHIVLVQHLNTIDVVYRSGRWRRAVACSPAHTPANSLVDRFMDNSNRRQYGMGIVGRMTRYINTKKCFLLFFSLLLFRLLLVSFACFFYPSVIYCFHCFRFLTGFINGRFGNRGTVFFRWCSYMKIHILHRYIFFHLCVCVYIYMPMKTWSTDSNATVY